MALQKVKYNVYLLFVMILIFITTQIIQYNSSTAFQTFVSYIIPQIRINDVITNDEYLLGYNGISKNKTLTSMKYWLSGIGGESMSNEDMQHCTFNESLSIAVPNKISFNSDPFYRTQDQTKCKGYKQQQFSTILDRTITIKCSKPHIPYIYESNHIFINIEKFWSSHSHQLSQDVMVPVDKSNIDGPYYMITLQKRTQSVWIKCGNSYQKHLALLPLSVNKRKYHKEQQNKYKKYFDKAPPNVLILVLDSTSRSNFIRAAKSTVNYLNKLMIEPSSPSHVFQFFRHTTVSPRTYGNMNALVNGLNYNDAKYSGYKSLYYDYHMSLFEYYERFGYNAVGWNDYLRYIVHNNTKTIEKSNLESKKFYFLSSNVMDEWYCGKYAQSAKWNDFITKHINNFAERDEIAQFLMVHIEDNHIPNGQRLYWMDQYLWKLLQQIDLSTTIVHLTADHGNLMGDSLTNIYGQWEQNNPMSILLFPKQILLSLPNEMRSQIINNLKINQQRMVTHYDMHLFWKQIPLLFSDDEYLNDNWNNVSNIPWIYDTLPKVSNKSYAIDPHTNDYKYIRPSMSIMGDVIDADRSCDAIEQGWCFCDPLRIQSDTLEVNKAVKDKDKQYVTKAIARINHLTGNGEWHCIQYDVTDFKITSHIIRDSDNTLIIGIQEKTNRFDHIELNEMKKQNRILSFIITIQLLTETDEFEIRSIDRLDYFKYEECLEHFTSSYRNFETFKSDIALQEPVFRDYKMMQRFYEEQKEINLRFCRCKNT